MTETWRDIAGTQEAYDVSDSGNVRNNVTGRTLKPTPSGTSGYLAVTVTEGNHVRRRTVHRLMATAFLPNPTDLPVVRHLDGDLTNNVIANLAWGTYSDNNFDAVAHGTHYSHFKGATTCIHGHPFDEENTGTQPNGRTCRACARRRTAQSRARKKETK